GESHIRLAMIGFKATISGQARASMAFPVERIKSLGIPTFRPQLPHALEHLLSPRQGVARPPAICSMGGANVSIARRPIFQKYGHGCSNRSLLVTARNIRPAQDWLSL